MNKVIVITGPTAVGKTKLSIKLAHLLNGEVINCDSTQVYKHLDIATAKVTIEEMESIPHHLIDIKNIDEDYSVYDFQIECRKKIDEIFKRNKTPILVGGTGLYIKAALYDYNLGNVDMINYKDYDNYSNLELYNMLLSVDKDTLIHMNNRKRVIKALNYYNIYKRPYSEKVKTDNLLYDTIFIGLTTDRSILYDKINNRVDNMIENGLIDEAYNIYKSNIRTKAVMTPIGYKELFNYFDKSMELDDCIDLIKKNYRHYSKKQYTWCNNQFNMKWFDVDFNNFDKTINDVYKYIETTNT
ncbi:MAG: tRNA (adenosine(37)-N6)-dimethylallyltransferase MiaA [Bacilli bacterium]|nr:tRNA (adenosine(37)-N6)-dimethylallyltransferase MiaA [Bacilli bacterium]